MDSLKRYTSDLLFGADSNIIPSNSPTYTAPLEIIDSTLFDLSTLLLFVLYICLIYYYRVAMRASIRSIFHSNTEENLIEESGFLFNRYIIISSTLGLLTLTLISIKLAYEFLPINVSLLSLPLHIDLILLAYLVMVVFIRIFQITSIKLVGFLIDSPQLSQYMIRYNRLNLTIVALILSPVFLLISQLSLPESPILTIFTLTILFFLLILHIYRSCKFFIRENISILYSILYLCVVDLFPISFMVLLIYKHL